MNANTDNVVIDSHFDGGNIRRLQSDDDNVIRLSIEPDAGGQFFQWFFFRVVAPRNTEYRFQIENAAGSSYPGGWENYRVVVSSDFKQWVRRDARYDGRSLSFDICSPGDVTWVAYFAPYTLHQHQQLITRCASCAGVNLTVLGTTVDGRSIDALTIGDPDKQLKIWTIARQHPGETMAQWWMEGYLDRLCDGNDPLVNALLDKAVFYVVPNMNPDGSYRGYLRTNAAGVNLNREWNEPSRQHSPEVFYVRKMMQETGVSFSLDVHGDEALPYNFVAGTEGTASWNDHRSELQDAFKQNWQSINSDFQTQVGYPLTPAGRANYGICSNYVAEHFDCLALTLEMPFKDTELTPDEHEGWSVSRSKMLGSTFLDALDGIIDRL